MGILFDEYLAVLIILLGLLSYLIVSAYGKTAGAFSKFHTIRCLKEKLRDFTPQEIEHAIRYYIWPECQSDEQVQSYLKKRFSLLSKKRRKQAQEIIDKIPNLFPIKDWTEQVKSFLLDGLDRRPWRFPVYFAPFKRKSWQMGEKGKTVEIKPFEISIYPITNREYEEFDPLHRNKRNEYSDKDDQPVVNITWEEADRYCRWLSEKMGDYYRLPQEVEWEFVASGGGQRKYPWGDEKPSKELANYIDSKIMKTKPVNSYPLGMTPEGIFNMAGNVWEWCDDWYNKKQQFRVIRGGSFFDLEHYLHCVYRIGANFNEYTNYIGFRVVRDIKS